MGTQSICGLGLLSFLKFGAGARWLYFEISKGLYQGFPGNSVKNLPAMQETLVRFLGWERSPGEGIGYPLQYSWVCLVAQLVKNLHAMWESWVRSLGWEDPLEKGKATLSGGYSLLAWRLSIVHGVAKSQT